MPLKSPTKKSKNSFLDGYFSLPGHNISDGFTIFWFLLTHEFSGTIFVTFLFIKIIDDGLEIRQVFRVSGVWILIDGLDLRVLECVKIWVFKMRGLRRVFASLDITFHQLLRNFFDVDSQILDSDGLLFGPGWHALFE
ncbi:unnamed protein product [Rhizophagus irregularis]|nr:unnamed protein product [Rhizophagus irregularis]